MQTEFSFPFPITPAEVGGGKLAVFFSIKSGSGASTLACLAAISLAENNQVALADLNPESKIRTYMGFPADVSSASILDINGANLPESVISASEVSYIHNLKVFPGAVRVLDSSQISAALHQKACISFKKIFPYTVAAVGPLYSAAWAGLLLADYVFVVLNPSRTDMDCYQDQMGILERLGIAGRSVTVMNKLGYPGALDRKGILAYFTPDMIVPYDKSIAGAGNRRCLAPSRDLKNQFRRMLLGNEVKERPVAGLKSKGGGHHETQGSGPLPDQCAGASGWTLPE